MIKKFNKGKLSGLLVHLILICTSFLCVFPFYWIMVGATNSTTDIVRGKLFFGSDLMLNMEKLLATTNIWNAFFNTAKITIINTVLTLIITSMAGYGFAKYLSKLRNKIYNLILFSMMIPFAALMIPLFQLTARLNIMDQHIAVVLPTLAAAFLIFFFRQSFSSFPQETIEAARIDGFSELRIFFSIVMPSSKSAYAAAAIWAFMNQWNNYLWPLLVLQSEEKKTLTLTISSLSSAYFIEYGPLMLAIVIATVPVIIMFLSMQKYFVSYIAGSGK